MKECQIMARDSDPNIIDDIEAFRLQQKASQRLYEELSGTLICKNSQDHSVGIRLADLDQHGAYGKRIHFELAWTCPAQSCKQKNTKRPLHLRVDTTTTSVNIPDMTNPTYVIDREYLEDQLFPIFNASTSVVDDNEAPSEPQSTSITYTNLHHVPNLCEHLKVRASSTNSLCAGYLQKRQTFRHLVYASDYADIAGSSTLSLEEVLKTARNTFGGMREIDRVKLSTKLVRTVLRLYSTPWLPELWKSKDVLFHNATGLHKDWLDSPYLTARISSNSMVAVRGMHDTCREDPVTLPIRNMTLFRLGIILLELAYATPFQELQAVSSGGQGDIYIEYRTAKRLGDDLAGVLGPEFKRAANICLHTALETSDDLSDPETQEEYFHKVIKKLDRCLEKYTEMYSSRTDS